MDLARFVEFSVRGEAFVVPVGKQPSVSQILLTKDGENRPSLECDCRCTPPVSDVVVWSMIEPVPQGVHLAGGGN